LRESPFDRFRTYKQGQNFNLIGTYGKNPQKNAEARLENDTYKKNWQSQDSCATKPQTQSWGGGESERSGDILSMTGASGHIKRKASAKAEVFRNSNFAD